jgi:hypothetical protein
LALRCGGISADIDLEYPWRDNAPHMQIVADARARPAMKI